MEVNVDNDEEGEVEQVPTYLELIKVLGPSFRKGKLSVEMDFVGAAKEFVLIYFSAHWAPPCRLFTPQLADFYRKANHLSRVVEVVMVSSCMQCQSVARQSGFLQNLSTQQKNGG